MKKKIDIVVSDDRFRKNIGDLEDLKASISKYGQIRPVLIDKKGNLISGLRRYQACVEMDIEPDTKVVEFDDPKGIEFHDNIHSKPYTAREIYHIWLYINETESKKPGRKDDNSVTNRNGLRPIDKAAMVTSMGTTKVSNIITIFKSPYEEIKTKLDDEKISVNAAYNMVKQQNTIAKDLENEAKAKDRFQLKPYGYDEGMFFLPVKYKKSFKNHYIINKTEHFPTLTTQTRFFHAAPSGKDQTPIEFTPREYSSVQDFPRDFIFVGENTAFHKQVGNAVSPKMGAYVTKHLKGKTCGDLFAGCGGFSLGAHKNNIKTKWAVEWDVYAAKSYSLNFRDTKVYQENLKKINPSELEKVDIIIGGPPCQGFSLAGNRFKDDKRNELYKEFLRYVEIIKPNEFIMENVPQISEIKGQIISDFNDIGYEVETKLVKGEEINMRQHRNRFFFFGTRRDKEASQVLALAA